MLARGHAIEVNTAREGIQVLVPNLYKLEISLPLLMAKNLTVSYFDCKIRHLIVVIVPESSAKGEGKESGETEEEKEEKAAVDTKDLGDDLLFDIV